VSHHGNIGLSPGAGGTSPSVLVCRPRICERDWTGRGCYPGCAGIWGAFCGLPRNGGCRDGAGQGSRNGASRGAVPAEGLVRFLGPSL